MATKAQPIEVPDNDTPEPRDDFLKDVAELMQGEKSGGSDNSQLMLILQLQNRADDRAREDRRLADERARSDKQAANDKLIALLTILGPPLIAKLFPEKKDDAMVTTLLGIVTNKKAAEESAAMQLDLMRKSADINAESMRKTFEATEAIREESTRRAMDALEERLSKSDDSDDAENAKEGTAAIIREIRLGVQTAVGALPNVKAALASSPAAATQPVPAPAAVPGIAAPVAIKPVIGRVLEAMMYMQTGKIPVERHRGMRGKIAGEICNDPDLTGIIVRDDELALTTYCQGFVNDPANAAVKTWIFTPGVADWILEYIRKSIQPLVRAMADNGMEKPTESPIIAGPGSAAAPADEPAQEQGT